MRGETPFSAVTRDGQKYEAQSQGPVQIERIGKTVLALDPQRKANEETQEDYDLAERMAIAREDTQTQQQSLQNERLENQRALREMAAAARAAAQAGKQPQQNFQRENMLADDYRTATKNFATASMYYNSASGSVEKARTGDPAAQQRLIFGWMKLLDPPSVVRPTEYATAENAQGVPERIRNLYNKVLQGTTLDKAAVDRYAAEIEAAADNLRSEAQMYNTQYTERATAAGVEPSRVVMDYFPRRAAAAPTSGGRKPGQGPAQRGTGLPLANETPEQRLLRIRKERGG